MEQPVPGRRFEERDDYGNYEANLRFLREAGLAPGAGPLLGIGSGKGRMLDLLRREGYDARGVEVNAAMIDESRRLFGDLPIQKVDGATPGLAMLRVANPDKFPLALKTNFYVKVTLARPR
jgi:hypothetical protein